MLFLRKGRSVSQNKSPLTKCPSCKGEQGIAVLIAMIALSIFSVLGMYMSLNATTEVWIADNVEGKIQAEFAASAGINHARELFKGLTHDLLLTGPDGTYTHTSDYVNQARTYAFRNPLTWETARSLDILNPASTVFGLPDDGILNTGKNGAVDGTVLIPIAGVALSSPNPYGSGNIITSRYFVKVTDNNGEASERAAEGVGAGQPDDPFVDADGIIVVRSMGVAGTIRETRGGKVRANSISVYEMRYRQNKTFSFDSPLVLQGDSIVPSAPSMFDGASFGIDGGLANYGIATIDPNPANGTPVSQITSQLSHAQERKITGRGGTPSVADITTTLTGDGLNLLNAAYLWNFTQHEVPIFADGVYQGNQSWSGNSQPYVGFFDPAKEATDPVQNPKITYVNGDLSLSGGFSGGGLLVVTGALSGGGSITWNGLIFVIGKGDVNFSGMNVAITGGLYVVNVQPDATGVLQFGTPKYTMAGNSQFLVNGNTTKMMITMIPSKQTSFRKVTGMTDP